MERNPFTPEEPESESTESSPKKRRGGDFLSQYLLRRRERQVGTATEEEDSKESEEKPKKWRRLFSKIFPSVVERPPESTEPKRAGFDLETWLSWSSATGGENPTDTPEIKTQLPDETSENKGEIISPQGQEESFPNVENPIETKIEAKTPDKDVENQGPTAFMAEMVTDITAHTEVGRSIEEATEPQPHDAAPMPSIREVVPETVEYTHAETEREVVINRGSNALPIALVGAEYLARKRSDRKLEKRLTEKLEKTSQKLERGEGVKQELRELVKRNQEEVEALKLKRSQSEVERPNRVVDRESVPTDLVYKERSKPETTIVPSPKISVEQAEPHAANTEVAEVKPQKIFEKVAEAAEHDEPVERIFERSHEVKDEASAPLGATHIGTVASSQVQGLRPTPATYTTPQNYNAPGDSMSLPIINDSQDIYYRQAMKAGFWAAVLIIILGLIAYLMIK